MAMYGYSSDAAQAGQPYDSTIRINDSFTAEEVIAFGLPLMRGSNPEKQVKVFNGGVTTEFLGISGYSATRTEGAYAINSGVRVFTMGRVWIPLTGTLTVQEGDIAYLNITDDVITNVHVPNQDFQIGRFTTGGTTNPGNPKLFVLEIEMGFTDD
jgi:hypothetical protein